MLNQRIDRAELPDDRLVFFILMVENLGVLEMLNERAKSLEPGICEVAYLDEDQSTF